jgi:outer membrane protein OmpA-like peptidoglycan-associated protein
MNPALLTLVSVAFAEPVSPTGGLVLGQYLTAEEHAFASSFEGMGRLGVALVPWFDLEAEVSSGGGSLKANSDYVYSRSTARLGALVHATPHGRADLFASAGAGLMWAEVEVPGAMPEDSPNAIALFRNPATVPHFHGGVGMTLWVAGPLHVRADVRWVGSLGGDPTREVDALNSAAEWTLGIDLRAPPPGLSKPPVASLAPDEQAPPGDDADQDGVPDATDACADAAEDPDGFEDDDGCPEPDNDGDGVRDAKDACPDEAEDPDGFEDNDGCPEPDNDGDGVADRQDRCRTDPETWNSYRDDDGCPDEPPEDMRAFAGVIRGITFETGNADIRSSSRRVLEMAAEALVRHPELVVEVQGHTDNLGDAEENLRLSQARAEAVVGWLVLAGVDADRLMAVGYGETRPMAENETDAGRAENRRVEFLVGVRSE